MVIRTTITAMLLVFCIGLVDAAKAQDGTPPSPAHILHQLFEDEWQTRLSANPFLATRLGDRRYDDRVPDVSPDAQAAAVFRDQAFLARLDAIDATGLSAEDKLNAALFRHVLEERLSLSPFRPWRIPFLSDSGFHTQIASLVEAQPLKTSADYQAYVRRLSAYPAYIDQQIANMRMGLSDGFTQPRAILDKVAPSFAALVVADPADSIFMKPFETAPDAVDPAVLAEGRAIVAKVVLPALARLNKFIVEDYMPGARTSLGASDLPQGRAYYDELIKRFTTLDLTASEIHQLGLKEAERIRARMNAIIAQVGFEGSFPDFLTFLRTDPQFYAQTPQQLLSRAAWIAKNVDEKMPAYFGLLPRMPYGVRAVPDNIAPNYTTGRYWGPIPGVRGGLYMVNTYNLAERPLYTLPALTVHEAVPGHHHQNAIAREQGGDVPTFRKNLYINAFGEGWGLYTEHLGEEMGIYETPYEMFGRLTYEMWRAGRLVVDTGIHAMGWSREEAVAFFEENSALARHNINTEVDRYISWPGQALAYKLGELKIKQLRARAEQALGDDFDIRTFHDTVLKAGTQPLPVLERRIDDWIAAQQEAAR